ncbi:putative cell cycle serine/threonine-protein kinase CDC5 [Phytophthora citrophthora]|uniref:Cell cycle serine/threonine-protein kinase CDC5 n=1 Tax=Phytophthora citrophthora TaxID=4793 RepID=A0AAD9LBB0_9STRA|nr:putative cell cycle serine/threonine-protein kinase CDC5 [Phytophthora citrophthora]
MTVTLVYARNRSRNSSHTTTTGTQSAAHSATATSTVSTVSSRVHRHIKVSSRLAPQIYLGHIYQSQRPVEPSTAEDSTADGSTTDLCAKTVVVKNAGQLQRDDVTGRLQGPWKEWQAARQLRSVARSHPNVVQVFDTFVQRSHVFLVMEHCARGDLLADLVATQPESRLDQTHALRIMLHLARGLRFLHETCNIAHRDVSLENVFVSRDEVYKLGDFGLSTRADVRASGCVGKAQYVAPEVVAEASYDPVTADVWSLGILFFMLLTGAPLLEFASPSNPEFNTVKTVGCRGVLRSWNMDSQLSEETLDLLSNMLQFDPIKRLQTMKEVLNHPALLAASCRAEGGVN